MQVNRMKLNLEQCSNLPFPIGCRVWYDIKLDARDNVAANDISGAVNHGAVMERKWGALLGGIASDEKRHHDTFSFRIGFVSAAFLDMMASNILYEITPINDVDDASPETRLYPDDDLRYAPGCRVNISRREDRTKPTVSGQVLLCRLKLRQQVPQEHCLDTTEKKNTVLRIKAALAQENARILRLHKPQTDSQHVTTIIELLKPLLTVDIDNELLTTTKIGASVSKLKSYSNQEVAKLASSLLSKWHRINDSNELCSQVLAIKQRLESEDGDILDALCSLNNVAINIDILRSTGIGKVVAQFKKSTNTTEAMLAKELVNKWKEIASMEKKSAPVKPPQPTSTVSSQTNAANQAKKDEPPVFLYTVKVARGDGSFHIEDGIAEERVKYCHDDTVVERATPTKSEPSGQTNKMETEVKPESKSEGVPTWLASPSTLTISETTMEMPSHDNDSQEKRHKRKSGNQDVGSGNTKRSCSKDASAHALSVKPVDAANPTVTPKQSHPYANISGKDSNGKENIKVPIRQEAVRFVVGTHGQIIGDIQKRTGCEISIPPKGHNGSNEPLYATITGGSTSAIEKASEMIKSIINETANCSPSGSNYCKVNIPPWLVYDDISKARLHHFLNNRERNMNRIGADTNCFLEINEWTDRGIALPFYDPSYIFIKKNACLDANSNLRRAKEDIEDILREYIHKDGSQGRLFYDTAILCNQFHGQVDRRSTTVHQRNPFSINNQYMYINVVELPYHRDPVTKTKEYHGHFLIYKYEGILRAVSQKTGCTVKICGNSFNVSLKYCDPYVFLYGDYRNKVDEAYLILTDAIKDRLNLHKHWIWNEHSEQRMRALEFYNRNLSFHQDQQFSMSTSYIH